MYEYTSAVFAVGLEGFAPVDDDRITAMAAEGWEPAHMTPVHNGFAAVVLFRRKATGAPRPVKTAAPDVDSSRKRAASPAKAAGRVRKTPAIVAERGRTGSPATKRSRTTR